MDFSHNFQPRVWSHKKSTSQDFRALRFVKTQINFQKAYKASFLKIDL